MGNIAEAFEAVAGDEEIEFAVIGKHYWDQWRRGDSTPFNKARINQSLTWAEAREFLDYEYDSGYGGADCHPAYAWTATKVIFVSEYDGATGASFVPRKPQDCEPEFK
jgi:Fe-S cluster biosynthesis and repair protein YggX